MTHRTPLADLIQVRMHELGLSQEALGQRLGYDNPAKAAGRVYALCNGQPFSAKSRFALWRLPEALELPADIVLQAVFDTERLFVEWEREAEDERRRAREAEDAAWRAAFHPHAVIQTEHTVPTQITFCGLTGGARRLLVIPIDTDRSPITYIEQAVAGLHERYRVPEDGRLGIPYFGRALGLIINYTPDQALRCDLQGTPLEVEESSAAHCASYSAFRQQPWHPAGYRWYRGYSEEKRRHQEVPGGRLGGTDTLLVRALLCAIPPVP